MTTTAHGRRTPHAALRPRRLRVADVMSRDVVTLPERTEVAQRRRRIAGVSAADVMSAPAASIEPEATLRAAARCLGTRRVRRLVVVDADEHVVGIVSRRDLLAAFTRPDDEIRRDIVEGVLPRWLTTIDPAEVTVGVHDGMVRIEGTVDRRSDAEMLTHLVSGLDGVVDLDNSVDYRWND